MNVKIKLVVVSIDYQTKDPVYLVSDESDIIGGDLQDYNVLHVLKEYLRSYLDTNIDWISIRLVDVVSNLDHLEIIYACQIPNVISVKHGKWMKIAEIQDEKIKEFVFKVIRKVLSN